LFWLRVTETTDRSGRCSPEVGSKHRRCAVEAEAGRALDSDVEDLAEVAFAAFENDDLVSR
jgi:hypothetical protein